MDEWKKTVAQYISSILFFVLSLVQKKTRAIGPKQNEWHEKKNE